MKEPNLKKTLISGIISLILCASMLIGTTFSWFTDSVSTPDNIVATGTLDIELEYLNNKGDWKIVDENTNIFTFLLLYHRRVLFVNCIFLYVYQHQTQKQPFLQLLRCKNGCFGWCGRQDLNLHALRHMSLNHTCLPIPPRPHLLVYFTTAKWACQ